MASAWRACSPSSLSAAAATGVIERQVAGLPMVIACQYLEDPEYNRYTIEYVAQSVGYANKTTFYAAFKKHTGLTPSQYQRLGLQQRKKTL